MPNILIRGLSSQTIESLKARAKRNGRSFQSEMKQILEQAAENTLIDAIVAAGGWRKKSASRGKPRSDSVALIREDRER